MLHILWMFIVGILVGAIARMIDPAAGHMGLIMTGILGIAGSVVGGFIAGHLGLAASGSMIYTILIAASDTTLPPSC